MTEYMISSQLMFCVVDFSLLLLTSLEVLIHHSHLYTVLVDFKAKSICIYGFCDHYCSLREEMDVKNDLSFWVFIMDILEMLTDRDN